MNLSIEAAARTRLEEALRGQPSSGVEIIRGVRPGLLDAEGARALSAPFLAAFIVAAALLRLQIAHAQLDLLGLLLRSAAFAFCLRALILLARFGLRTRADWTAPAHALAVSREGLVWQSPTGSQFVRRSDVLALCVPEHRASRLLPSPRKPLLLVTLAAPGSLHWSIPPYFSASSEILGARLTRALDLTVADAATRLRPPPALSASERYAQAAAGHAKAGETVIPEGQGYRARGPYGVFLGVVFALDALASAGAQRAALLQPVLLSCLLALLMPAGWLWLTRRKAAVRLGIAMLLTPEELIVRGKHGVVSVPYAQLTDIEVRARDVWSPFVGTYTARSLLIRSEDGAIMTFDGGFLGIPPEVVAELCTAYRSGRANPAQAAS